MCSSDLRNASLSRRHMRVSSSGPESDNEAGVTDSPSRTTDYSSTDSTLTELQISHSSTPDSSPKPSDKVAKPADKENQPPSSARASLGSKKKVPTLNDVELRRKRVKPDSDSEDTSPPHNTKRIKLAHRSDPSASVLCMLFLTRREGRCVT